MRRSATAAVGTGRTFATIDCPSVLKVPQFTGGLHVITQAAAPRRDRLAENIADRRRQSLGALPLHRTRQTPWG